MGNIPHILFYPALTMRRKPGQLLVLLILLWLIAGCRGGPSSGMTATPASDCLTPMPEAEISALYPKEPDLWPIEDCHAAYAAARSLASGGHVRLTEITQIISIERIQFRDEPAWQVELRGQLAFDPPPMPPDSPTPTQTPSGPVYGCMRVIVLVRTSNYASVGSMDCPSGSDLPSSTP